MQKTLRQVLSILTVFVVLLSTFLVPVHAQDIKIEKNKDTVKGEFLITGFQGSSDRAYAIRLVDTIYANGKVVQYKTRDWVIDAVNDADAEIKRDPIFGNEDGTVDISREDLIKIYKASLSRYRDLSYANEGQFFLGEAGGKKEIRGELPSALYLMRFRPGRDIVNYGPAILGINIEGGTELDLKKPYTSAHGNKLAVKSVDPEIRKSFLVSGEFGHENAKLSPCYSPRLLEKDLTFVIDNIHIRRVPKSVLDFEDYVFRIEDTYPEKLYDLGIKDASDHSFEIYSHYLSEYSVDEPHEKIDVTFIEKNKTDFLNTEVLDKEFKANPNESMLFYNNDLGFKLYISKEFIRNHPFEFITVKYKANFNKETQHVCGDKIKGNKNNAEVNDIKNDYMSNHYLTKKTHASAYVYELPFLKYDKDKYDLDPTYQGKGLEGAVFNLYSDLNGEPEFVTNTGEKDAVSDERGFVKLNGLTINFVDNESDLDTFNVNLEKGQGINYLKEVKAPEIDGVKYQLNPTVYKIMINGWEDDRRELKYKLRIYNTNHLEEPILELDETSKIDDNKVLWHFPNSQTPFLPSTGSNTMMVLTVIGIAIVTGVTVVHRKKKHATSVN